MKAFEYAKSSGLDLVTVCPTLVLGPLMYSVINSSSLVLIKLLKEGYESAENKLWMIVDVRDVAEALRLVYEAPEAEGRYILHSTPDSGEGIGVQAEKHLSQLQLSKIFY